MRKWLITGGMVLGCVAMVAGLSTASVYDDAIKAVMKEAMKGGLCKKVAEGKASDDEKEKLVSLFENLSKAKPPKGDEESWTKKTNSLLKSAKGVAKGNEKAVAALKKAANCKACHDVHKGE